MQANEIELLKKIIDIFPDVSKDESGKCHIISESGYDESTIIGTEKSLLKLSKKIIEIILSLNLANDISFSIENEERFSSTDEIKNCFSETADVWPVCLCIANNEDDVADTINLFKN